MKWFRRINLKTWCTVTVVYSIVSSFLTYIRLRIIYFCAVDCCCANSGSHLVDVKTLPYETDCLYMNVLCTCRCLIRWLFNFTKSSPLTLTWLALSYLHYYGNIKWLERFTKNSCHHLHQFGWCPVVLGIVCQLSL